MSSLTVQQFAQATGATLLRASSRLQGYVQAMEAYGIDTRLRIAFFLANVGHESGGFAFPRELWQPTPTQAGYEGRADLGNTQAGDGLRYRGAGDLQITGRRNFAAARDRLRAKLPTAGVPDFEADPDALAQPQWAALAAADYVLRAGCHTYADAMNFDGYCDLVNRGHVTPAAGDARGFASRLQLCLTGLRVLP